MKITDIKCAVIASSPVIRVTTDEGITGWSQIETPKPYLQPIVLQLKSWLVGQDPVNVERVMRRIRVRGGFKPWGSAVSAIEIALWDIAGKAASLPVYRLLGGENRPIFTYATGGYYRPDATSGDYGRELARFLDLGYRAVKLKTGAGSVAAEAARIGAVRRAIGDEPLLMLDMNAAYDLPDCIEFARAVEPHRIFWLEEPLHWYLQPADFARLAAATLIPLAHGERELTRFTVRDFIVQGGIRYVQFDATRAGGFTEALRIGQLAEQHGVMLAPHTAPELHGHLVLAAPRCVFGVESHGGPETDPLAYGLFREHPELRDGHLHFGDRPGFGLEVDWAFVNRYRL